MAIERATTTLTYIPDMPIREGVEYTPSLMETARRMHNLSAYLFDLDGFVSRHSPFPTKEDGTLDFIQMDRNTPDTLPILQRTAKLETAVPQIPCTGKSWSVLSLYRVMNEMLIHEMERFGMVDAVRENADGFHMYNSLDIHPAFIEPKTGRIRARDRYGKPTNNLVFAIREFDNGGAGVDFLAPNGFYYAEKFSNRFFENFDNPHLQALLYRTSRERKINQQKEIMKHHVKLSDDALAVYDPRTSGTDGKESQYWSLWTESARNAGSYSYASPHGSKFNLDLENNFDQDAALLRDWNLFFGQTVHKRFKKVEAFSDLEHNLKIYFNGTASIKTNFVPGNGSTLGDRIVMDFNPAHVNKEFGLMKALDYIRSAYSDAGLPFPAFMERDAIAGGDGPMLNDYEAIQHPRGVTNNLADTNVVGGFPTKFDKILPLFGISPIAPLRNTEYTLVFTQLLLHARMGSRKYDLPTETLAKLRFS